MDVTKCATWNLKVFFIKRKVGPRLMKFVLRYGIASKPPTVPFMEYLENLPDTSTANYRILVPYEKENYFTEEELEKLRTETSYEHLNMTLMFKLIQVGSENMEKLGYAWKWEQVMEGYVASLSRTYDSVVFVKPHEEDGEEMYEKKMVKQTEMFMKILVGAKEKYNMPESEFTTEKDYVLKTIADVAAKSYEELLQMWEEMMLPTFKTELLNNSKTHMYYTQYEVPLPFVGSIPRGVYIDNVFSKMTLKEVSDSTSNGQGSNTILDSLEVLSHIQLEGNQTRPKLLVVSGYGGSGKTTFLSHIACEWMKEKSYCRMKGLEYYDAVMNCSCVHQFNTSSASLIQDSFNDMNKKYGALLPILIRQCKLLMLIDDINLRQKGTIDLVNDILKEGQDNANLTLICTTRPESLPDFVTTVPANFDTYHMKILGIPFEERTEFVLKYYDWCSEHEGKDTAPIRKVVHDIGWKGHFQLPLNLVLLAQFFHEKPDSVKTTLMQSKLHHSLYNWHKDKLRYRLNSLEVFADRRSHTDDVMRTVFSKIVHVAMKALNNNRLYLSQEEVQELSDTCDGEKVPSKEVIGTFFHLQQHVGPGAAKEMERFSLLDRGLQEFLAAMYVLKRFAFGMKKGEIKNVLKRHLKDSKLCPATQKNVLWHLSGILTYKSRALYGVQVEVVNMIHEAGMNTCNEWLSLIEEADDSHELVGRVAHYIEKLPKDLPLDINDSTVECAIALLPLIPRRRVTITLSKAPLSPRELMKAMADYKSPDLYMKSHFRHAFRAARWEPMGHFDLMQALQNHTCTQLLLKHQFRNPTEATPSAHLLHHQCWNHLESFEGYLHDEGLAKLPKSLKKLSLAVAEENRAQSLLTTLSSTCQLCPQLHSLVIHVPVTEVTPSVLVPLPTVPTVKLMLSGVNDEHLVTASRIAAALHPGQSGYDEILFPRSSIGVASWRQLMERLTEAGVKVKTGITAVLDSLTDEEGRTLDTYAVSTVGCNFSRIPEDKMWECAAEAGRARLL